MLDENALDHVYKLFYGDLNLCGCGRPEAAFELVRDILRLAPFYDNPEDVERLIGTPGAYHIVLSALTDADLIEHGGGIGGSWMTDKGRWYVKALDQITDWSVVDGSGVAHDVGFPHDGEECAAACWA